MKASATKQAARVQAASLADMKAGYDYDKWSASELCAALGIIHDITSHSGGQRCSWLVMPAGKRHCLGTDAARYAMSLLSRLARLKRLDPQAFPAVVPLALINGQPQDPNNRGYALRERQS